MQISIVSIVAIYALERGRSSVSLPPGCPQEGIPLGQGPGGASHQWGCTPHAQMILFAHDYV